MVERMVLCVIVKIFHIWSWDYLRGSSPRDNYHIV
jgi:hypothetical protein